MLAVILAGGKSRRMGADKAELPFMGDFLLSALARRFSSAGFNVAVSQHPFEGAQVLFDEFPGCGPMAGLHSAFSQTKENAVFLTAVDMPFADPSLALELMGQMGGHDACVIKDRAGRAEPLFAAYGRGCFEPAAALLRAGSYRMTALLDAADTLYLPPEAFPGFDAERILENMNTPEDAKRLLN